ncbi:MAG: hydroxyacid dehydrogenase [Salibacteraceae bacterium]|nr:hydroxyacid dehydrogenase [Salibacteraceae bacterium]|tara:strand:+ start:53671 stop:54618 length:948 start_codon:yes stop_codon:yes gene_type:complete
MPQKGKVLFIDSVHSILRAGLEQDGWECDWCVDDSVAEIKSIIGEYNGVVIRSKFPMNREIIDLSTKLKFIARSGAGLENIDLDYAQSKGIKIFNSPEGNRDAVGEQSLGMLLNLFQKLNQADAQVRKGIWDRVGNRGIELKGKTVGVIGFGNMGRAFAQRLQGFECEVIAYDKYVQGFGNDQVREVGLAELQEKSDVISFHTPLTEETHYYFNAPFIENCKKSFYLINTARGKVVETAALVQGLESGKVEGACLDVIEYESSSFENILERNVPEPFEYLLQSDKVLLTPHVAGWTAESYEKLSLFLLEKIRANF